MDRRRLKNKTYHVKLLNSGPPNANNIKVSRHAAAADQYRHPHTVAIHCCFTSLEKEGGFKAVSGSRDSLNARLGHVRNGDANFFQDLEQILTCLVEYLRPEHPSQIFL